MKRLSRCIKRTTRLLIIILILVTVSGNFQFVWAIDEAPEAFAGFKLPMPNDFPEAGYGWLDNENGVPHPGIDINDKSNSTNTDIKSAIEGKVVGVTFSNNGLGNAVVIEHKYRDESVYYQYGHLSKIFVQKGQQVKENQVIGKQGSTGYSSGNHLHFEIRRSNHPDPTSPHYWPSFVLKIKDWKSREKEIEKIYYDPNEFIKNHPTYNFTNSITVAFVADLSSSMSNEFNDPKSLQKGFIKSSINLLKPGDKITVIGFADKGFILIPLTEITEQNKQTLFTQMDESFYIRYEDSNIQAGLESVKSELEKEALFKRKLVILTSDGRHQLDGDPMGITFDDYVPKAFGNYGWPIYTILFDSWSTFIRNKDNIEYRANPQLMQKIAGYSKGQYLGLNSPDTLQKIKGIIDQTRNNN